MCHAVCDDDNDERVAGLADDVAKRRIDRSIYPKQRIADLCGDRCIVAGMVSIVDVPALVPGTVSFGEDLHEEIPPAPPEQCSRELALEQRSLLQSHDESALPPPSVVTSSACPGAHPALADVRALGVLADDDEVVALGRLNGRWLTYRSSVKRIFRSRPRSMTPGGTSGVPTAPRRIASKPRARPGWRPTGSRRRAGSAGRRARSRRCRGRRRRRAGTLIASAVTSGPMPSPPITAMRCVAMAGHDSGPPGRPSPGGERLIWPCGPPVASGPHGSEPAVRAAHARLQAEFDDLTTRGRIEVADKIERARELGDLSENGDYHAAKDEQGHMEGRIRQLE